MDDDKDFDQEKHVSDGTVRLRLKIQTLTQQRHEIEENVLETQQENELLRDEIDRMNAEISSWLKERDIFFLEVRVLVKEKGAAAYRERCSLNDKKELQKEIDRIRTMSSSMSDAREKERSDLRKQIETLRKKKGGPEEKERQAWNTEWCALQKQIVILRSQKCEVSDWGRPDRDDEREALQRRIEELSKQKFEYESKERQLRQENKALREEIVRIAKELTKQLETQCERARALEDQLQRERNGHVTPPPSVETSKEAAPEEQHRPSLWKRFKKLSKWLFRIRWRT